MTENRSMFTQEERCHLAKQSFLTSHDSSPYFPVSLNNPPTARLQLKITLKNPGEANESAHKKMSVQGCAFMVSLFILQDPSDVGKLLVPVPLARISCSLCGDSVFL